MRIKQNVYYLAFFVLLTFLFFYNLGNKPIRIWDEARHAVNAQEMLENGHLIVPHFRGKPEMWTTKPPLLIWSQALSMKVFGMSEFAVRLPSAIAGMLTCLLLVWFTKLHFKQPVIGIIASLILVSSPGYLGHHVTRTGDFDALLTLFSTAAILLFYHVVINTSKRHLPFFFMAIVLGVYTKGIAILIFAPVLFAFLLVQKKGQWMLSLKQFYIFGFAVILIILAYYVGRNSINPGYLQAVYDNELGGRFLNTIESHLQPWHYYFKNYYVRRFTFWLFFLIPGIGFAIYKRKSSMARCALYLLSCALFYLIVLSSAASIIQWYDAPTYPLMALFIALILQVVYQIMLTIYLSKKPWLTKYLPTALLTMILMYPLISSLWYVLNDQENSQDINFYDIEYFVRDNKSLFQQLQNPRIVYDGYDVQIEFYVNALKQEGVDIKLSTHDKIEAGETIIACQDHVISEVTSDWVWSPKPMSKTVVIGLVE